MSRIRNVLVPCSLALALAACASGPAPIRGEFPALSPDQVRSQSSQGASVRWGGSLIAVEPAPDQTCFVVLSRPLTSSGKPMLKREESDGRFLACRSGFYDPALFAEGRDVTFTGRIEGFEERQIGAFNYRYPKLAAEVVYLWPEDSARADARYAYPMRSPYWGPWWGYRPYW
jgi:outer membrane lipoprotein